MTSTEEPPIYQQLPTVGDDLYNRGDVVAIRPEMVEWIKERFGKDFAGFYCVERTRKFPILVDIVNHDRNTSVHESGLILVVRHDELPSHMQLPPSPKESA